MESLAQHIIPLIDQYGMGVLVLMSFLEAFIQPIPIVVLLAAVQGAEMMNGASVLNLPTVLLAVYLANCAGAVVGYWLGWYFGRPVVKKLFGESVLHKTEPYLQKYGNYGVFIAGVTPIPFKVSTWMAGMYHLSFLHFMLAVVTSRAIHIGLYAAVVVLGFHALDFFVH